MRASQNRRATVGANSRRRDGRNSSRLGTLVAGCSVTFVSGPSVSAADSVSDGGSVAFEGSRRARRRVRLLHTSDVHIAGGFTTPKHCPHGVACLCPILAVEAAAHHARPDAILIVGDLFDHPRVEEPHVRAVFEILARMPAPVVLLAGNHDVHDHTSPYLRHPSVVSGAEVTYLGHPGGELVSILDGAVRLWGKAMEEHSPSYRPLHGVHEAPFEGCSDERVDDAWFVVVGHGHYVGDEPPDRQMRSSPITASDVAATRADYVALGHWHVTTDVSTPLVPAWYCGSPLQVWAEGNVLIIDMDPELGVRVQPLAIVVPESACVGTPL